MLFRLPKHKQGRLSDQESNDLNDWKAQADNQQLWDRSSDAWDEVEHYGKSFQPDVDAAWGKFSEKIQSTPTKVRRLPARRPQWWRVAAAVALLLIGGGVVYQTLFSGTVSHYNDSAVAKVIELSDGTRVSLNQYATIKLAKDFANGDYREVDLEGEAYFEVAKNTARPFIIQTAESSVKVLGTAFNLRAHPDEDFTELVVTEGRVAFGDEDARQTQVFTVGQAARVHHNGNMEPIGTELVNKTAWLKNKLIYDKTPLATAIEDANRFFGVEFDITQSDVSGCTFNGTFQRSDLQAFLKTLDLILQPDEITQSGDRYLIKNGACKR